MSTNIRPELSYKNKYWISKHRFYELKHFCMQYPEWKREYNSLDSYSRADLEELKIQNDNHVNPIEDCVIKREYYYGRMSMVENAVYEADEELYLYILRGVTTGCSYDFLKLKYNIPCSRETYYDRYRKFFWILDEKRD